MINLTWNKIHDTKLETEFEPVVYKLFYNVEFLTNNRFYLSGVVGKNSGRVVDKCASTSQCLIVAGVLLFKKANSLKLSTFITEKYYLCTQIK